MSRIRRPRPIIESIVKTRRPKKFEESDIKLFVEAVLEDADEEADEVIIEETVIDSIIEAVLEDADDEEADEAIIEETVVDSIIEAIIDKIAGGEAVRDKTAGEIVAIFDKAGERSRRTRDRIQAALRHSIVYRPRQN